MSRSYFLRTLFVVSLTFATMRAEAQFQNRPNGMSSAAPRMHALVGVTLIPSPGTRIDDATVVLRDGGILSVESGGEVPAGAVGHDYRGRHQQVGLGRK